MILSETAELRASVTERSAVLREFPADAADMLLAALGPDSGTRLGFAELRALGGALAREPTVPNVVSGRDARWSLVASGAGQPELLPVFAAQLGGLVEAMAPWAQQEMSANLLTPSQAGTPAELRAVYGARRYDRLAAIKRRYDPDNVFRMNHNIVPA